MLSPTDATGIRPVVQTDAGTTITSVTSASQETLNRLSLVYAGKQFQGKILSRMNDGTFLVRVADTTVRMPLPDSAKTGDTLTLTLLSTSPRPTFVLGDAATTPEETAAQLLQNTTTATQISETAATAQGRAPPTAEPLPNSATATLSPTARLVDNLLHAAQLDGSTTVVRGQTPLLPAPLLDSAAGTASLAQSLQQTLEFSGLFYESHVAQWLNGKRSLESLAREPQARLNQEGMPSVLPKTAKDAPSLMEVMRTLESTQQTGNESSASLSRLTTLNNESARLINLQLNTLEHKRIEWQGELWPGQRFEWAISEETPRQTPEGRDQESTWRSTVRFEMPTLGVIEAAIDLANGHVQMRIQAASETTASQLRANGKSLAEALQAAGSPLDLLTVKTP